MSPQQGQLRPGQQVAGRYRIVEQLGQGGMATVYRALHLQLGKEVALKVMNAGLLQDEAAALRFIREARLASQLEHPNTVAITDFGQDPATGQHFLVMELLRGQSLWQLLRQPEPQPLARLIRLFSQVCSALEEAHARGLVHRDLKPANIFVCRQGGMPDVVKVLDFGLAKSYLEQPHGPGAQAEITHSGEVLGTPHYMSPEQAQGLPLSPASDLYSLGVILFEALTGQRPFEAPSYAAVLVRHCQQPAPDPRSLQPGIPDELAEIVLRTLAKQPHQRFADAGALREALLATAAARQTYQLEGESDPILALAGSVPSGSFGPPSGAVDPPHRPRRWLGWLAVALLLLLGGVVGWLLLPPGLLRDGTRPIGPDLGPRVAAPRSVTIELASSPPGALVQEGSRELGHTPLKETRPATDRELRLRVSLPGCTPQQVLIDLTNLRGPAPTQRIHCQLVCTSQLPEPKSRKPRLPPPPPPPDPRSPPPPGEGTGKLPI